MADLVERLNDVYASLTPGAIERADLDGMAFTVREAADRIAALEAEALETARLLGMGGEREANLHGEVTRLKKALARAEAEASEGERWQPISSAPKGRVPFLALNHDGEVHVAAYDEHDRLMRRSHYALRPQSFAIEGGRKVLTSETEEWRNDWSLWTRLYEFKPTHWRPLPPPPSQDREPDSQRGAK